MSLPIVAIVGRPNVGKSSLFNAIVRERTAIVEPTAGVTRDRLTTVCEIDDLFFELVDTGGYGIVDRDDLGEHVERQIRYAVDRAAMILFVVDAREGLTPLDRETADLLRRHGRNVILLANKVDEPHMTDALPEFLKLGFGEPIEVSALSNLGIRPLRELIHDRLKSLAGEGEPSLGPEEPEMKIALVGKRNAGKSTFVNTLAGEDRVIVSEIPGTTRDSIDVRFDFDGQSFIAIDTAGVRRRTKLADDIEFFAQSRAMRAIERADVVLFLIDATVPVGGVEKRLAQHIHAEFKPCIIVVNKWDLSGGRSTTDEYGHYLDKVLPEVSFAPVSFTSALTGANVRETIKTAGDLFAQARTRVSTGQLNQALQQAVSEHRPRMKRGKGRKRAKFFYATQISTAPPTIVVFVNDPRLVSRDYERFLLNRLRQALPYEEIPLRLWLRSRRPRSVAH